MGYTTSFEGSIELSRKLTMAEAKLLLEIAESDKAEKITGINAYFQWVPAETFEHIVWDGNEKFYKYTEQLKWLCGWLKERGISATGDLYWQGEETGDTGVLSVTANEVSVRKNVVSDAKTPAALSMDTLGRIALDQVTA